MVEFGLNLLPPSAEPMVDRHEWYLELLRRGEGAFTSAWVPDHLISGERPMLEAWTTIAYLAAEAPSYTFGNLVLAQSYRTQPCWPRWPRRSSTSLAAG